MQVLAFEGVFPNLDFITSPDTFFDTVREEYPSYYESGFFQSCQGGEAILLYRIITPNRAFTGVIGCAAVADYLSDKIKRHEHTLADKEQVQTQLLLHRRAAVKPVLLTYPNAEAIDRWVEAFTLAHDYFSEIWFEKEQQRHLFWRIELESDIIAIQELFRVHVPVAYLADGHHRAATIALLHERMQGRPDAHQYNAFLSAWFPAADLDILEYNRVINDLEPLKPAMFVALLSRYCHITPLPNARKPSEKHEMTLWLDDEWYSLRWKPEVLAEHTHQREVLLDVSLFNDVILHQILSIEDVRNDQRVEYIEGPRGLDGLLRRAQRTSHSAAFALYPVALSEIMAIADAGQSMPPKSTWFEPRMKNGLVVQEF